MKIKTPSVLLSALLLFSLNGRASDDVQWSEFRLFHATNKLSTAPASLNALTAPDNTPALDTLPSIGIEVDGRYKWIKFGVKFGYTNTSAEPANSPFPATAYLKVSQLTAGLVGRVPIIDQPSLIFDAFAELGAADTEFTVQTISSGKAVLKKDKNFYQRAGVSAGVGNPSIKLYVEAGQEWNKVDDLSASGTMTTTVTGVDLSGTFYAIGLIITDVPEWMKPKFSR